MSDVIVNLLNKHYDVIKLIRDKGDEIDYEQLQGFEVIEMLLYDYEYFSRMIPEKVFKKRMDWNAQPFRDLVQEHPEIIRKLPKKIQRWALPWLQYNTTKHNLKFLEYIDFAGMEGFAQFELLSRYKFEDALKYIDAKDIKYYII